MQMCIYDVALCTCRCSSPLCIRTTTASRRSGITSRQFTGLVAIVLTRGYFPISYPFASRPYSTGKFHPSWNWIRDRRDLINDVDSDFAGSRCRVARRWTRTNRRRCHRYSVTCLSWISRKCSAHKQIWRAFLLSVFETLGSNVSGKRRCRSEYIDWRPGLGALLQPVPFPEDALTMREVQQSVLMCVMQRLAKDPRCTVHRVLLPVREPRPGWIHIAAPSSPACPDRGELFGEMVRFYRIPFLFFLRELNLLSMYL